MWSVPLGRMCVKPSFRYAAATWPRVIGTISDFSANASLGAGPSIHWRAVSSSPSVRIASM